MLKLTLILLLIVFFKNYNSRVQTRSMLRKSDLINFQQQILRFSLGPKARARARTHTHTHTHTHTNTTVHCINETAMSNTPSRSRKRRIQELLAINRHLLQFIFSMFWIWKRKIQSALTTNVTDLIILYSLLCPFKHAADLIQQNIDCPLNVSWCSRIVRTLDMSLIDCLLIVLHWAWFKICESTLHTVVKGRFHC
jgi:hypothetical protein